MPMDAAGRLTVTVVYCAPAVEDVSDVQLPAGSTVGDAVTASQLLDRRRELCSNALDTGVWGRRCALDQLLVNGDRVEIYRPLQIEPKERRRLRAKLRSRGSKA